MREISEHGAFFLGMNKYGTLLKAKMGEVEPAAVPANGNVSLASSNDLRRGESGACDSLHIERQTGKGRTVLTRVKCEAKQPFS
jgi:hypothetical protein